jgi:hypothetical protein
MYLYIACCHLKYMSALISITVWYCRQRPIIMYKFNQIYIYTHKTLRGIWLEDGREYGWPVKGPNRVKCQTSDGVAGENIALGCWSYTYGPLGM